MAQSRYRHRHRSTRNGAVEGPVIQSRRPTPFMQDQANGFNVDGLQPIGNMAMFNNAGFWEISQTGYEPNQIFYYNTLTPVNLGDITQDLPERTEAVQLYMSHTIHDHDDIPDGELVEFGVESYWDAEGQYLADRSSYKVRKLKDYMKNTNEALITFDHFCPIVQFAEGGEGSPVRASPQFAVKFIYAPEFSINVQIHAHFRINRVYLPMSNSDYTDKS